MKIELRYGSVSGRDLDKILDNLLENEMMEASISRRIDNFKHTLHRSMLNFYEKIGAAQRKKIPDLTRPVAYISLIASR